MITTNIAPSPIRLQGNLLGDFIPLETSVFFVLKNKTPINTRTIITINPARENVNGSKANAHPRRNSSIVTHRHRHLNTV
jgi:hypothetical protein